MSPSTDQCLFLKLPANEMDVVIACVNQWVKNTDEIFEWEILEYGEYLELDMPCPEMEQQIGKLFSNNNTKWVLIFIDKLMPIVLGRGILMDKYFADPHADMQLTINIDNIRVHDPYTANPD
jgi:hypothetical protein